MPFNTGAGSRALAQTRKAGMMGSMGGIGAGVGSLAPTSPVGTGVQQAASRRFASPGTGVRPKSSGRYSAPQSVPQANPGPIAPVTPPPPSIDDFLNSDSGYQQQLREFANALGLFDADVTRRRGTLEQDYNSSKKAMEDQRVKDLDLLEDDYGARGILRSGLYADAVGDYEQEYGTRQSDLLRRQNDALATLDTEGNRFRSQQDLQKQAAREAAIRRRAEQYGI